MGNPQISGKPCKLPREKAQTSSAKRGASAQGAPAAPRSHGPDVAVGPRGVEGVAAAAIAVLRQDVVVQEETSRICGEGGKGLQRDGWDVAGSAGLGTQLSILGKGRHATRLVQGTLLANTWK